jgi:hypothetical protein
MKGVPIRARAKIPLGHPVVFLAVGVLTLVSMFWLAAANTTLQGAENPEPEKTPHAYLPFITHSTCPGNVVANGSFEQGQDGWHQYTTGTGWKAHDLIGSDAEGFLPNDGHYAARLGGYEGVWDVLTQTVSIPTGGQFSFWWQMGTYETEIFHDHLLVDLLALDGSCVAVLASHDVHGPEGVWQQDVVDISAYAGQTLVLRLHAYNDNYYFSWFDIDQVCLYPGG